MTKMVEDQGSLPDQDEAAETNIAVTGDEGADSSASVTDDKASSSEANQDADDNLALLSVVKQAVEKDRAVDPSTTDAKADTPEGNATTETPEGNSQAEAEAEKLPPFHNHPRWKELIAERDSYKPDAEQYRTITGFMNEHELQPDEMAEGMLIMGLMKTDPEKALERMLPHVSRLQEFTGKKLPDDLQRSVDDGLVTEEIARETAQLRLGNEARASHESRQEATRAEQAQVQHTDTLKAAVNTWEAGARQRDPDFAKKADLITDQTRLLLVQRGRPSNPADAVALVKDAYEIVSKRLSAIVQRPAATKKTPVGSRPSNMATPEPRSLADVVRNAAQHA